VYRVGAKDPAVDLWLATGSRPPESNTEHQRLPRLGLIDPTSGMADLIEFNGEPVWDVLVDPQGQDIVYMDQMRQAVVRFSPFAGRLEFDKKSFEPRGKLLLCPVSGDVFLWNKTILRRCNFAAHEDVEPVQK
jgi:hypothetical protein